MSELTLYAGYGPNLNTSMVNAITGEQHRKVGSGVIQGAELCVQLVSQTPTESVVDGAPSPQQVLLDAWGHTGSFYVCRPSEDETKTVAVNLFNFSPRALELMRAWELVELGWKEQKEIKVLKSNGQESIAMTELLSPEQTTDRIITGNNYPRFLNNKYRMLINAVNARIAYLSGL